MSESAGSSAVPAEAGAPAPAEEVVEETAGVVDVIEAVGAVPVSASPAVEGVLETASTLGSACSAGA